MSVVIAGEFLSEMRKYFDEFPAITERAAMMAINQSADRKAVPMIRKEAESQVAFPAGYLDDPDRLGVTQRAQIGSLEAVVTARDRPTSLARFAPGQSAQTAGNNGVLVEVHRGKTRRMKKAFFVKLKNGNVGVAIRLKDGVTPSRAYKPVVLAKNVYLLYGPSVDQVVRTVAEESLPEIGTFLGNEFYRQFARLSRG